MYCTIDDREASSLGLSPDARAAHAALARQAHALGRISASLTTDARAVTRAFEEALLAHDGQAAWRDFIRATAALVGHGASVATLIEFDAIERAAQVYFERIVLENADLLDQPLYAVA